MDQVRDSLAYVIFCVENVKKYKYDDDGENDDERHHLKISDLLKKEWESMNQNERNVYYKILEEKEKNLSEEEKEFIKKECEKEITDDEFFQMNI